LIESIYSVHRSELCKKFHRNPSTRASFITIGKKMFTWLEEFLNTVLTIGEPGRPYEPNKCEGASVFWHASSMAAMDETRSIEVMGPTHPYQRPCTLKGHPILAPKCVEHCKCGRGMAAHIVSLAALAEAIISIENVRSFVFFLSS
jgi:hypothetical protein